EGLSVRMAFQQGAHRPDLVRALARFGLWLGSGLMLMVSLLLWLRPEWVVSLFMNANVPGYQETLDKAVVLAGIAAVFLLFDGYQVLATWMLRGLKDTLFPMLLGLSGYWVVGLGLGAGFSFVLGYGAPGLWWGFALGLITAGALLLLRLYNRLRAASAGPR
ncbi:MAG: MATE family efflux transporter, partial [Natronospirillum sp.]